MTETYTYRGKQKITLKKRPDEFVVRALPERARDLGGAELERVSSASTRIHTRPEDLERMMARSREIAPTHHSYEVADTGEEFLVTDRIFVRFKKPPAADEVARFAGKYGLRQLDAFSDRSYLFQLTDHTGVNPVKLVVKLTEEESSLIELAENDLNYRARKMDEIPPSDPAYARQWHLHGSFHHSDVDPRAHVRCEDAWRLLNGFGSPDVVVAVTDDGCKLDHPDFDSQSKFVSWGYFQGTRLVAMNDIDAEPSRMYQAGANHGTSCAGVIAGEADSVLTVGAAPHCRLLPIKWESSGPSLFISDSKIITALRFLSDKADVVSNSWGGGPIEQFSTEVVDTVRQLGQNGGRRGKGILFLWAAGNDNRPIHHDANVLTPYDDGWSNGNWVGVSRTRTFRNNLVGVPGVTHVAAMASTAQRSHYSNYGTGIGICAPSSNSHAYWRMPVRGLDVTTTTGQGTRVTDAFGGTSSATPLVAGIAALVISANPTLTAVDVLSILKRTASKDLEMIGYSRTPPANFDPNPSWDVSPIAPFDSGDFKDVGHADGTWSPWFGHGRVDAEAAVAAALATPGGEQPAPAEGITSRPDGPIPDDRSIGIRNVIAVPHRGSVDTISVAVEITHTYIGDLRVTLLSPSGRSVVLHDRHGANAHDLRMTYDFQSTPALRSLQGEDAKGDWTLWVQDLAPADSGRLKQWSLRVGVRTDAVIEVAESPGTSIPDNSPSGVDRILTCEEEGNVRDLEVSLDITHTYIGDLLIKLTAPDGTVAELHRRAGGGTDNLLARYTSAGHAALAAMHGQPVAGDWTLNVSDRAAADVGKLNRWGLRIVTDVPDPRILASKKKSAKKTLGRSRAKRRTTAVRRSRASRR